MSNGKGDARRPENAAAYRDNWERVFLKSRRQGKTMALDKARRGADKTIAVTYDLSQVENRKGSGVIDSYLIKKFKKDIDLSLKHLEAVPRRDGKKTTASIKQDALQRCRRQRVCETKKKG